MALLLSHTDGQVHFKLSCLKYELLARDSNHVELRNTLQSEQSVVIDLEALRGIASILNKAARELEAS